MYLVKFRVRKGVDFEVGGKRPRGKPLQTTRRVTHKDMKAKGLKREDAENQ